MYGPIGKGPNGYALGSSGRLAQRESAAFTRQRSLVQSQYHPPVFSKMGQIHLLLQERLVVRPWPPNRKFGAPVLSKELRYPGIFPAYIRQLRLSKTHKRSRQLEHCLGSARCNRTIPCIGNCTCDRCGVHQGLVTNVRTVSSWCWAHVGRALSSLYMLKSLQICITANRAIGTVSACRPL